MKHSIFNRWSILVPMAVLSIYLTPIHANLSDETSTKVELEEEIMIRNIKTLEGNPEYIKDHRQRFRKQQNESRKLSNNDDLIRPLEYDQYLFRREGDCSSCTQDVDLSKRAFKILTKKPPEKVSFDRNKIYPFDGRGTCSAMALDFLARYIKECSTLRDYADLRDRVKSFAPYYKSNTTTYISRQASYNTIKVDKATSQSQPDLMKHRKMQALANFHTITLTPASETIKLTEIQADPEMFKALVDRLPEGTYAVRALSPRNNVKMESYGHTMVLIKKNNFSIYYDNSDGAAEITNDVGGYVRDKILTWRIPEVRFYDAKSKNNNSTELSEEASL